MFERGIAIDHINGFSALIIQLGFVDISFDNEFKALTLLSSLLESWNALVVVVRNSMGLPKLTKDHVVGLILSETRKMVINFIVY